MAGKCGPFFPKPRTWLFRFGAPRNPCSRFVRKVFSWSAGEHPGNYNFDLTLWNGSHQDIEDPYRFPRLVSDFDLYIHGEGTQYESYGTMGAHLVEYLGV